MLVVNCGSSTWKFQLKAASRLGAWGIPHTVVHVLEPGRFRAPRNAGERAHAAPEALRTALYPDDVLARVFVSHSCSESLLGVLQPLHTGPHTMALGFINQGGTLNTAGRLFVNRCTWAHIAAEVVRPLKLAQEDLLSSEEWATLEGKRAPAGIVI